jgi:hypothetical protein
MKNGTYKPVTVGDWMITYLLLSIPIVNIILIFVWAFGNNTPVSKANWAKASLIWSLIGIVLSIIFYVILFLVIGVGAMSLGS